VFSDPQLCLSVLCFTVWEDHQLPKLWFFQFAEGIAMSKTLMDKFTSEFGFTIPIPDESIP
jgi:hypothetical protein